MIDALTSERGSMALALFLALSLAALGLILVWTRRKIASLKVQMKKLEKLSEEAFVQVDQAQRQKGRVLAILESMAEGVLVVDSEQKILTVNSALVRDFDLDRHSAVGRYFWELIRDAEINQLIETCLSRQTAIQKEHKVLLAGLTFEIQASPVFVGPDFLGTVVVFHNVTRLKELERARTEFVANVSHELKTPLTSILGFVETLKEGGADDAENRQHFLDIIQGHAKKLHRLIEDLLLLSRAEPGTEAMQREKVSLPKLVDKVAELLKAPLQEKHLTLTVDCIPQEFFLKVQPTLFSQALFNLIENAIKYNHVKGKVVLRACYDLEEARIQVADTGLGIPEADQAKIFERFYRVDRSRSRDTGGAGLGLAIAKHIVERHGGRIELESTLGQGSVFTVILPGVRIE